jgi:hypothetical protein
VKVTKYIWSLSAACIRTDGILTGLILLKVNLPAGYTYLEQTASLLQPVEELTTSWFNFVG